MSKADLLDTIRFNFDQLASTERGTRYVPDSAKIAAMAERIRIKTEQDPTRLGGITLDDIRP